MREGCVLDRLSALGGVDTVASLPCDRTQEFCALIPERFRAVNLTREEDGVGISAGLAMAGARSVLHMQSSGLGNSLNAIMSLTVTFGLPLPPVLTSWRGVYREAIPAQVPFNRAVPEVLRALGIPPFTIIRGPEDEGLIDEVVRDAYDSMRPHVGLILPPSFWEGGEEEACPTEQVFPPPGPGVGDRVPANLSGTGDDPVRRDKAIAAALDDEAVVANIGVPSKELYAASDRALNFYMLGSYTQATPIGLGLALATDKDVVVLDGDGSLLGTAVLPVVAAESPRRTSRSSAWTTGGLREHGKPAHPGLRAGGHGAPRPCRRDPEDVQGAGRAGTQRSLGEPGGPGGPEFHPCGLKARERTGRKHPPRPGRDPGAVCAGASGGVRRIPVCLFSLFSLGSALFQTMMVACPA
ncbi:sulfopyruvate decarboxylase subunit alpha [Methanoculleus chikugoensis]|uniref:sulfopyruvate decarboxylase subunit alpha n=1 Tax=Methanoculleus chikugoensis TaxID=118126 RepID=UPI001FB4F336|nr:sulfopyruvate decarboxylase subunit alpha [Methanoculleus chikugoensis]